MKGKLSYREEEVLKLLFQGKTYREVAKELFISPETVRNHAHRIYKQLGVKNKIQAGIKFFGQQ